MKKCYTIGSLQNIPTDLDRIQFTENRRIFPTQRRTVDHLINFRKQEKLQHKDPTPIIIHWDFVYIVSRYSMMSDKMKKACVDHMCQLINYSDADKHIDGIVMHTDWPIQKAVMNAEDKVAAAKQAYSSGMWNQSRIQSILESGQDVLTISILEFFDDIKEALGRVPHTKIYLECTTKLGPNDEGSMTHLMSLFAEAPYLNEVYGICYDTEHTFAGTGEWYDVTELKKITDHCKVIVHLNTVPAEVKSCSRRDRHAETTIKECSLHNENFYRTYAELLDSYNIPWVRELHEEATLKEIQQL